MSLINNEQLWRGLPIDCNGKCFVYPMTVDEVIAFPQEKYNYYVSLITMSEQEIQKAIEQNPQAKELMEKLTPFQYLLLQASFDETFFVELEKVFFTFIREKVMISIDTQEIFIQGNDNEVRVLNGEDFVVLQNIIRKQNNLKVKELPPPDESPMARKFRLRREQVEEAKRRAANKSGEAVGLMDVMSSVVAMNMGETWSTVGKLYLYPLYELFNRGQMKEKYNTDIRMIAAGADPKKIKVKHFIGKLDL